MAHTLQRLVATGRMRKRLKRGRLVGKCQTPPSVYPGDIKERGNQGLRKTGHRAKLCGRAACQGWGCKHGALRGFGTSLL